LKPVLTSSRILKNGVNLDSSTRLSQEISETHLNGFGLTAERSREAPPARKLKNKNKDLKKNRKTT
jgi:hypothetical protein